jgi:hypothetical protein
MNNDREKMIQEIRQKVNEILSSSEKFSQASIEERLIFHLRVLHFLANPHDNHDKVYVLYQALKQGTKAKLVSKGYLKQESKADYLFNVSLNKTHWNNLLQQLADQTYPSFGFIRPIALNAIVLDSKAPLG